MVTSELTDVQIRDLEDENADPSPSRSPKEQEFALLLQLCLQVIPHAVAHKSVSMSSQEPFEANEALNSVATHREISSMSGQPGQVILYDLPSKGEQPHCFSPHAWKSTLLADVNVLDMALISFSTSCPQPQRPGLLDRLDRLLRPSREAHLLWRAPK